MISVIMLTYNRIQYLHNIIQDILKQSYHDFEYVIVDNGSTDGTEEVLKQYAQKDARIKLVILKGGESVGFGRNVGIRNSTGSYITFVDDDDRVENDFLEFLDNMVQSENADIAMCGASEILAGVKQPQCMFEEYLVLTPTEAVRELLQRRRIRSGMPTKLIRRKLLEKYPFAEDKKHEDIHTIYKYLSEANKIVLWGIEKYCFVRHGNNLSFYTSDQSHWTNADIEEYLGAFHARTEFLQDKLPEVFEQARYSEWSYMISMIEKINRYNIEECRELEKKLVMKLQNSSSQFLAMPFIKKFEIEWMNKYVAGRFF